MIDVYVDVLQWRSSDRQCNCLAARSRVLNCRPRVWSILSSTYYCLYHRSVASLLIAGGVVFLRFWTF